MGCDRDDDRDASAADGRPLGADSRAFAFGGGQGRRSPAAAMRAAAIAAVGPGWPVISSTWPTAWCSSTSRPARDPAARRGGRRGQRGGPRGVDHVEHHRRGVPRPPGHGVGCAGRHRGDHDVGGRQRDVGEPADDPRCQRRGARRWPAVRRPVPGRAPAPSVRSRRAGAAPPARPARCRPRRPPRPGRPSAIPTRAASPRSRRRPCSPPTTPTRGGPGCSPRRSRPRPGRPRRPPPAPPA